jgi:hypothetical protein
MANIWLDEGTATYLAGQESKLPPNIPEFETFQATDMNTFLENDGYAFSYKYIEFLDRTYSSRQIIQLIKSNNYEEVFGKSPLEIYNEWISYLEQEISETD